MTKERPILFSAPMVRAIIDGRKTQTRRIMKKQPFPDASYAGGYAFDVKPDPRSPMSVGAINQGDCREFCPYGQPGDQLWVRETTQILGFWTEYFDSKKNKYRQKFHAHHERKVRYDEHNFGEQGPRNGLDGWHTRPSIFMPRWASRIDLMIKNIRVERLQDISESDVLAEGIKKWPHENDFAYGYDGGWHAGHATHTGAWRALWEKVNGPGSYDTNPWVWVIEFERIKHDKPNPRF